MRGHGTRRRSNGKLNKISGKPFLVWGLLWYSPFTLVSCISHRWSVDRIAGALDELSAVCELVLSTDRVCKDLTSFQNNRPEVLPMKLKLRATISSVSVVLVSLIGLVSGCSQPDNPTPTAAAPPPAPQPSELKLPKIAGKTFDPASNPRYKKMQDNMAKQSGSSPD